MKTLGFLIQKEFLQVRRNRMMLPVIFVVPIVQLLILVHAATFELKNVNFAVADLDRTPVSASLVRDFSSSPYFNLVAYCPTEKEGMHHLYEGSAGMVLVIPRHFGKDRAVGVRTPTVQILLDAVNGTNAGIIQAYSMRIIGTYSARMLSESPVIIPEAMRPVAWRTEVRHWFNPELNFKTFMVPGILVLLVTIIGFLLSGMNVVREKEIGTIEQINVTPVKKYHFIAAKLIPFWIIGLFELALGLAVGKLAFDIPMAGSLWLIFLSAAVYLIVVLSMGLLVSTVSENQQQSMFISFFFMMIFILMSGLFTSVDSIPAWADVINSFNPVAYFIKIMRMVLLKGSGFYDILPPLLSIAGLAALTLSLAVWRYRKVG